MGRVGNRYVWQGGQTENQGGQTEIFFRRFAPNFCPPWPETLPAPLLARGGLGLAGLGFCVKHGLLSLVVIVIMNDTTTHNIS